MRPLATPLFYVALVLLLLGLTPRAGAQDTSWHDEIDALAQGALDQTGLPSAQIAVGYGDEVIFESAYGLASLEHDVPATTETLYRTASISKWFTGTAAMRLMEQGILDLDAPVQTYCLDYPEKAWTVTTRTFSRTRQASGTISTTTPSSPARRPDAERADITARRDRERISATTRYTNMKGPLATFADDPLLFEPGTGYSYSSHGYRLLGCVIEGAAGKPYREVLHTEVFEPSGATSIVDDDAWAVISNRADGYQMLDLHSLRRASFRM